MRFLPTCLSALLLAASPTPVSAEPTAALPLDPTRLTGGVLRDLQELHRKGMVGQLDPDKLLYKFVTQDHSFVNGSNSFHEKLREPGIEVAGTGVATLNALTSESCNSHNMLKLSRSLMEISPDPAVADFHENALYNHLVATVAPDHGKITYYLSMRPGDHRIHVPDPVCCQGTGIELAGRLGEGLFSHRGKEL